MLDSDLSSEASVAEDGEVIKPSRTYSTYKELLKSPKFVLSFQPRFYEDADLEDEELDITFQGMESRWNPYSSTDHRYTHRQSGSDSDSERDK